MAVTIEEIFDKIATKLIENPIVNKQVVNNNQLTVNAGQLKIGRSINDNLLLYQKDEKANESDLLAEINISDDSEIENFVSVISIVASKVININNVNVDISTLNTGEYIISITETGNPSVNELLSDVIFKSITTDGNQEIVNPLNVSQFIPLEQSSSIVNVQQAEEFLDTNIFELLPTGDTRQARVTRFFQELNALLPPNIPQFDSDGDGMVDRGLNGTWTGSLQYSQDNSISYAQSNTDGNIDEEDAFIHRLKSTANDTNSSKTIEDIYNTILPYLDDILEIPIELEDIPKYQNQSSGYLQFRNPNQGIIIRNTNKQFVEGLDPSNPTYLNTDGTGGFTITMWVRFLDKVSEGTLFNFGNPTRGFNGDNYSNGYVDDDAFGFTLETFVLNRDDTTGNTNYPTWGDVSPTITNYNSANAFDNSNTARFVRLMINDNGQLRDSTVGFEMGTNYGQKLNTTIPFKPEIIQEDNNVPGSYTMRLFGSTLIPEDFNEWYFICASFNPLIPEDSSHAEATDWSEFTPEYWLNHMSAEDTYVSNSNLGNKCKVEIISRSDLLRARGFKG